MIEVKGNPLKMVNSVDDIKKVCSEIVESSPDRSYDPFWDNSIKALLEALTFYICATSLVPDIKDVFRLLQYVVAPPCINENETIIPKSSVDIMFENLEKRRGGISFGNASKYEEEAIKAYKTFKLAPNKTASGVVISAQVLLTPYILSGC